MTNFFNYQQQISFINHPSFLLIQNPINSYSNPNPNLNENSYLYFLNKEQFTILKSLITINLINNYTIIKQNDKYIILKLYINQHNFSYLSFFTF